MDKPIIGIAAAKMKIDKMGYKQEVNMVANSYVNLIIDCGGIPLMISPDMELGDAKRVIERIDGLFLIGGEDIKEICYNCECEDKETSKRDENEVSLYRLCKESKKPILGICRGMQLINVAENGTLCNIEESSIKHNFEEDGWTNYHEIRIKENTKLKNILNYDSITISSCHHQKINKLGENLIVSATSKDEVVEAVECNYDTFIMGFQGHFEKIVNNFDEYKKIVKEFIGQAGQPSPPNPLSQAW